jgi:hypothetical protein
LEGETGTGGTIFAAGFVLRNNGLAATITALSERSKPRQNYKIGKQ